MDWSTVAQDVAKSAPVLGTLLGGPAGGAIGSLVASALGVQNNASDVSQALVTDPDAAVKLKQIESDNSVKLHELVLEQYKATLQAQTQAGSDINATMQAESKSEHWLQFSWRPIIGLAVAADLVVSVVTVGIAYVGVMFCGQKADALQYLPSMLGAMAALIGVASPILGIASYFRGKTQLASANGTGGDASTTVQGNQNG